MPVPVFCCFWFQKSCSGNILGIGRNKSQSPYFHDTYTEYKGEKEEGRGPPSPCHGAGGPWAAPPRGEGATGPNRPSSFCLYIAPDAKTLKQPVIFHEEVRSTAAIQNKFRGTELSVPVPCRDDELPPEPSPSTPPPSSSPLLPPMMRRE